MTERRTGQEGFVVTRETIVAEVLERVPGALELLISYGFTPLADPVMRATVTKNVSLETGSIVHSVDLEALLRDLNQLAQDSTGRGPDKLP